MSTRQFLVTVTIMRLILFGAPGIERYRQCQEEDGDYCRLGPMVGGAVGVGGFGPRGTR